MKSFVEFFVDAIIVMIACVLFTQVITMNMRINEARNYQADVVSRVEACDFNSTVLSDLPNEAKTKGEALGEDWTLSITDAAEGKLVTLEYTVSPLGVFRIFGVGNLQTGVVQSYAR